MRGKRDPLRRRSSRQQEQAHQAAGDKSAWTPEQVRQMLASPVYGYGWVLEPANVVTHAVLLLREELAKEQRERGTAYSLDELDQRFQSLFTDLVNDGLCTRGPDTTPLVAKEMWLQAQQSVIGRLADPENNE